MLNMFKRQNKQTTQMLDPITQTDFFAFVDAKYGSEGTYPLQSAFWAKYGIGPVGVSVDDLTEAIRIRQDESTLDSSEYAFRADELDRTLVRDILVERFGYIINPNEYGDA